MQFYIRFMIKKYNITRSKYRLYGNWKYKRKEISLAINWAVKIKYDINKTVYVAMELERRISHQ